MDMPRRPLHPIIILGSLLALLATLPAVFIAWLTKTASCEPQCHSGLSKVQFIIAVVGVLPVATLLYASLTARRRLVAVSLVLGIFVYALWGLLNDAAVHGWGNL
jgi:hypothetical protein